jgi:murein DD-endopeptidase MepM/ murein hydrolase activator NlpD
MHTGIDLRAAQGTPVLAMAAGHVVRVVPVASEGASGVEVQHADGVRTRYVHLSRINVQLGQQVVKGQVIGLSGGQPGTPGAGRSTGPHLHLEARRWNGAEWSRFDPMTLLQRWL